VQSSPVIAEDGTIVFGSMDMHLHALRPDGSLKWQYKTGGKVEGSPAIGDDGVIYIGSWDHCLHAVTSDGSFLFKVETGDLVYGSPTLGTGVVYFGSYDDRLYAVSVSSGGPAKSHWPQFHHDGKHTGQYTGPEGSAPW
jgi:outer membrane protein assembly factor BamB